MEHKNIKIHFLLTCISYAYFGFGLAVQRFGIKAGLGLDATLIIFISSIVLFMITAFTSMEKVKEILFKKKDEKMFEFENDKP